MVRPLSLCLLLAFGAGRAATTGPSTLAVKIDAAFTQAEIDTVKQIGIQADGNPSGKGFRNFGEYGGLGHRVVYLHNFIDLKLRDRMMQLGREAEKRAGWNGSQHLNLTTRCMELIIYRGSKSSSTAWHFDGSTLLTVAVMLTPRSSYDGGEVHFKRAGKQEGFSLELGDALVWRGWNYHTVTPVTAGERRVFVMEFWTGHECTGRMPGHVSDSLKDIRVAIQVDNESDLLYLKYGNKLCTDWPCANAAEAEDAFRKYIKFADIRALHLLHPIMSLIPNQWPICVFAKLQALKVARQMKGGKFIFHWVLPFLPIAALLLIFMCCCRNCRVQGRGSTKKD